MGKKRERTVFGRKPYTVSMRIIEYDRNAVVAYARKWAFSRNPAYYDFSSIGGDCTNFASQCLFAGCKTMNYTPVSGWFYRSANDRSAAWTGVEYFYRFLTNNRGDGSETPPFLGAVGSGAGPFAEEVPPEKLEIGDFVQLGRATGDFYHTPVVVGFSRGVPLVAAHTYDAFGKPLTAYRYERIRCLHILGARKG